MSNSYNDTNYATNDIALIGAPSRKKTKAFRPPRILDDVRMAARGEHRDGPGWATSERAIAVQDKRRIPQ